MKERMFIAILAMLVAVGFHSDRTYADGTEMEANWHFEQDCPSSYRISDSSSDCLQAGFHNGKLGGSTYWAENICYNHGSMVAHVDGQNVADTHFHLSGSGKVEGSNTFAHTRSISCCINRADELCWLDQVQRHYEEGDPNLGKIREVTVGSSSYTTAWVDVSTHEKRYEYCQSKPDSIYCKSDYDSDKWTDPNPSCEVTGTCNCGDHFCTADDCTDEWDGTTPAGRGLFQDSGEPDTYGCAPSTDSDYGSYFSAAIDATDGTSQTCTLEVVCGSSGGRNTYENGTWTKTRILKKVQLIADVDDIDDHFNCDGVLYEDSCHSGTAASTHLEDIEITID